MSKIKIILHTWYQETPTKDVIEVLPASFDWFEDACAYLGENYEQILNDYPVTKIELAYE